MEAVAGGVAGADLVAVALEVDDAGLREPVVGRWCVVEGVEVGGGGVDGGGSGGGGWLVLESAGRQLPQSSQSVWLSVYCWTDCVLCQAGVRDEG